MASIAPYESSITAGFTALGEAMGFLDKISDAFVSMIQQKLAVDKPFQEQREMDRRIRKCTRICRKGKYNQQMIATRVHLDFVDLNAENQNDIARLMIFELLKISLPSDFQIIILT